MVVRIFVLQILFLAGIPCAPVCLQSAEAQTALLPVAAEQQAEGLDFAESNDIETLLEQAQTLFVLDRPIDARTKLQKALQVAPKDFRPHMLLGAYYLSEVGHFRLALAYLRTAEQLLNERFGPDERIAKDPHMWRQHARLLYLLSEARLNLDNYQGSLDTLDRFSRYYWDDWYPGSKAWVLMKLKRVDEAIEVAQAGLLRGAEPGRTYNILGILFSLKSGSQVALKAFAQAIRAELATGGEGQVATPLNNAGEVYREQFSEDLAEAAWLRALGMPDGCEHILPSLNLAILYIDQLRLFSAERALNDFEACFAAHALRTDTEHRALIALARGRIALRLGDPDAAVNHLDLATQREQWFGKIGTNQNDLRFAALIDLANALEAKAASLTDQASQPPFFTAFSGPFSWFENSFRRSFLLLRAAWARRQARNLAIDELDDFEDLYVRHTDAMLEYPTLGRLIATFPLRPISARLQSMERKDGRRPAGLIYQLYLGTALNEHGRHSDALSILSAVRPALRPIERLAKTELLVQLIHARRSSAWFFSRRSTEARKEDAAQRNELFALNPSALRYASLALPVKISLQTGTAEGKKDATWILAQLLRARFSDAADEQMSAAYTLEIAESGQTANLEISLKDSVRGNIIASASAEAEASGKWRAELVNKFVQKAFSHRIDPPSEPVSQLELLEGIL